MLFAVSLQLSAQTSSETRNTQAIRKLYEAVNTKDLNYIKSLGDEKSEWLDVPFNMTSKGENGKKFGFTSPNKFGGSAAKNDKVSGIQGLCQLSTTDNHSGFKPVSL